MIPTPNQSAIQTALRTFLLSVLPAGIVVIAGQANRVGEPTAGDFVIFWPLAKNRLAFNIDSAVDAVFTGSIAGTTLNVTAVDPDFFGKLGVGVQIFGVGLANPTTITALGTGTGGIGTYTVSPTQTILSETIAAGTKGLVQKTEVCFQCDVHGPNSSDNAQVITAAIFDDIANTFFNPGTTGVAPLYCDDPRQVPFLNGEDQFETRWIVDVHMQINALVVFPQQFADAVVVDVTSVDATYPP